MEIPVDKVGRILAGDEVGRYVRIIDDADSTGGFLILTATYPDMVGAYDAWVEDKEGLIRYFVEAKWLVEWL